MNRWPLLFLLIACSGSASLLAQPAPPLVSTPALTIRPAPTPPEKGEEPKAEAESPAVMSATSPAAPSESLTETIAQGPASVFSAPKPAWIPPLTVEWRGRIEAEATAASQSSESKATIGDLQNGFGFRRVRLGAQGTIAESASWVSEVELAGGNIRLRDVFVGLDALPGVRQVRVGHFREPFSLDGMTSSNFMTFLERAPTNVISPARNWGLAGFWWPEDERLLFSLGLFRDGTGSNGQSVGDDDNWATTARLTGLPLYDPDGDVFRLVHVGGAISYRIPPEGVLNFTPRTGSNLLTVEDNPGSPFLPILTVMADNYQLYNLQAASVHGSLSLQGEWSAAAVDPISTGPIFIHGMYFYVSYFLTGEHRGYNRTRGSFDRVEVLRPLIKSSKNPNHGWGAFELAARAAYFDFSSSNLPLDINGNPSQTKLWEWTAGLNWYLNSNTRVMFGYTAGMPDKTGFEPTVAHLFGIRTALFW
jgi:phosphate-selective porin OprO/OprP